MQLATASACMREGVQVFKEYCEEEECPEGFRVVTRDPALQDNAALPAAYERAAGQLILSRLREGFRGEQYACPAPLARAGSFDDVMRAVDAWLQLFVAEGFAINARVVDARQPAGAARGTFTVQLEGPATLWALQSLASRRSTVLPGYDVLTVAAFLQEAGLQPKCEVEWTDTTVTERWQL